MNGTTGQHDNDLTCRSACLKKVLAQNANTNVPGAHGCVKVLAASCMLVMLEPVKGCVLSAGPELSKGSAETSAYKLIVQL